MARSRDRWALLLALSLCLFLTVGVPMLVIARTPPVHADSSTSPDGGDTADLGGDLGDGDDLRSAESGTDLAGVGDGDRNAVGEGQAGDLGDGGIQPRSASIPPSPGRPLDSAGLEASRTGPQTDDNPTPPKPLADAVAAAKQHLRGLDAAEPDEPVVVDMTAAAELPSDQPSHPGGAPQNTPNLQLLALRQEGPGLLRPDQPTGGVAPSTGDLAQTTHDPQDPASNLARSVEEPLYPPAHVIPTGIHPATPDAFSAWSQEPPGVGPPGFQEAPVGAAMRPPGSGAEQQPQPPPTATTLVLEDGSRLYVTADGTLLNLDGTLVQPEVEDTLAGQTAAWVRSNWEYLVAAGLVGGGVVVSLTGFGGPLGGTMISGGLVAAGTSAGAQKAVKGQVDWRAAAGAGVVGGATTVVALGTGMVVVYGVGGRFFAANPAVAGALTGSGVSVAGGMANRALHGDAVLDPTAIVVDLATGLVVGTISGRIGGEIPAWASDHAVDVKLPSGISSTTVAKPLTGTGPLGEEIVFAPGTILMNSALSTAEYGPALRHETVHWLLVMSPFRNATNWLNQHSQLWRYSEEVAAHAFQTFNLRESLDAPLHVVTYQLSNPRLQLEGAAALLVASTWLTDYHRANNRPAGLVPEPASRTPHAPTPGTSPPRPLP